MGYIVLGLIDLIIVVVVLVKFFQIAADVRKMRELMEKSTMTRKKLLQKKLAQKKVAPVARVFDNHELVISKIDTEDVKAGDVIEIGGFANGKYICYRNGMKVGAFSHDEIDKSENK